MKTIFIIIFILLGFNESYSQWIQQQSGTTITLHDIEFINGLTGWASGDGGLILKTSNGGINWINQPTEAIGKPLLGIHPVNENIVYATGWYNTILKTTNGGQNWINIRNGPVGQGRSFFSLFFINEQTGWVNGLGPEGTITMKTTDGGINWIDIFSSGTFRDLFFKDSLNGIGVGNGTFISRTSNGGINWNFYTIKGSGNLYRISIIDENIGFTVANGTDIVYKTTNFGETFDSVGYVSGVIESFYSSEFANENVGWVGANYNQIFKTENGGRTWRLQRGVNNAYISSIYALNDSVVWLCGAGGTILHTTNGGDTITSISQISTTIPESFELIQNYPNPFNPSTTIEFKINETGNYLFEIFDINGKIIQNKLSSTFKPGTYRYVFYANGLSSGIYFYRLTNTGKTINNSITKSMILLK